MNTQTLALGGAAAVAAVGAYFILFRGSSDIEPPSHPDAPWVDPNLNTIDKGVPAAARSMGTALSAITSAVASAVGLDDSPPPVITGSYEAFTDSRYPGTTFKIPCEGGSLSVNKLIGVEGPETNGVRLRSQVDMFNRTAVLADINRRAAMPGFAAACGARFAAEAAEQVKEDTQLALAMAAVKNDPSKFNTLLHPGEGVHWDAAHQEAAQKAASAAELAYNNAKVNAQVAPSDARVAYLRTVPKGELPSGITYNAGESAVDLGTRIWFSIPLRYDSAKAMCYQIASDYIAAHQPHPPTADEHITEVLRDVANWTGTVSPSDAQWTAAVNKWYAYGLDKHKYSGVLWWAMTLRRKRLRGESFDTEEVSNIWGTKVGDSDVQNILGRYVPNAF